MNNTIIKKDNDFEVINGKTENCVFCSKDTKVLRCTPVDLRFNYVDGSGQLCDECFVRIYDNKN